jgi:Domain of unknown function (DUF5671)
MLDPRLTEFVRAAKANHVSDESIVGLLRQQGWQERALYQALGEYYAATLGLAVPVRGSRTENARDAFFYLVAFIALAAWVCALVQLGDSLLDRLFHVTTPAYVASNDRDWIANLIATIVIAFPIHIWLTALIGRERERRPEASESAVRKWLTYIALVVTAIVLLVDATWFLGDFLRGELVPAFVAKAVLLAAIIGAVFWYYLGDIQRTEPAPKRDWTFFIAASIFVVVALWYGITTLHTLPR